MSGAILHTVTNVDAYARTGECRICGPVKVTRRGSASAPWRCRNQVNEYKRQRTQRVRAEQRDTTALPVIAPCGSNMTLPPFEEPVPTDGTKVSTWTIKPCSCHRSAHLVLRQRYYCTDGATLRDEVFWADWAEFYDDGVLWVRLNEDGDPEIYGDEEDATSSGGGLRSLGEP
jgi:hypothetical protein